MAKLYQKIASTLQAMYNTYETNQEWYEKHQDTLEELQNLLPSGSGLDCGSRIKELECFDTEKPNPNKFTIITDYHMMDENGYYCGWIENIKIHITPDWQGISMNIVGNFSKDKTGGLKDYLYETYDHALNCEVDKDLKLLN